VEDPDGELAQGLSELVRTRKQQWQEASKLDPVPKLVYGKPQNFSYQAPLVNAADIIQGIGSSAGQIEGTIKVISSLQQSDRIDRQTIIVVPYTDAGWSPLLARAGGLISEVGGRLSHGAIVAREYNIPAVMDVDNATKLFQDGQLVRIDGQAGTIEVLK
ncbi:MAG: PEP-utilizing enzyme, partial [Cyanobacteria bacterium J06631_6]